MIDEDFNKAVRKVFGHRHSSSGLSVRSRLTSYANSGLRPWPPLRLRLRRFRSNAGPRNCSTRPSFS